MKNNERENEIGSQPSEESLSTSQSWILAAGIVIFLIGFPVILFIWPPTFLPRRDAYLAMAMVPGIFLGILALWSAFRTRL